jgi:2-keto-4-pentenoate hydratase/2-oxohepta-3-ene-1,7-dioic acid hydratase in catechol pathway
MRLVRYDNGGLPTIGVDIGAGVLPTGHHDLETLIEAGPKELERLRRAVDRTDTAELSHPDRFLAPLPERAQLLFAGGNYQDHLAETGLHPTEPLFFAKLRSSVIGPGAPIVIPTPITQADWEAELALVIGRTAHRVKAERAADYIFGYTLVNDVTARDVVARGLLQMTLGKSPDTFGPLGPHIVTADAVADFTTTPLELTTRLNGVLKQRALTSEMVFAIPELLEFLTRTVTLRLCDIVSTGTAGGTGMGRDPQEFMQPGDEVTVAVTGVGELTNPVLAGWTDHATAADRSDR